MQCLNYLILLLNPTYHKHGKFHIVTWAYHYHCCLRKSPQPRPFVYHTLKAKHDLPLDKSLTREITCLLSCLHSSSGGGRSCLHTTLGKVFNLVLFLKLNSNPEQIHSLFPPEANKQRKARMWHKALQRKQSGEKMMLAAQKVIEEVKEEIGLSVPRDTINKLHSQFYDADKVSNVTAKTYIASISALCMQRQLGVSEFSSGDCNLR